MKHLSALLISLCVACSGQSTDAKTDSKDMTIMLDSAADQPPAQDMSDLGDMPILSDMSADADMPVVVGPVTRRPFRPEDVDFIDVHMHCDAIEQDKCVIAQSWREVETQMRGAGALLSVEHWTVTISEAIPEFPYAPSKLNEAYTSTVNAESRLTAFASLDCWHDAPFDDQWATACKADAKRLVEAGATGFKDHVGKQWDSNGDLGSFVGGWNRANGFCAVDDAASPNVECAKQPTVRYPIREPAWREVIRYITEELRVPVVTHAATYAESSAEQDKRCYDPRTKQREGCGKVSRDNQLEFAIWAKNTLSPPAFKRIIFAHLGFTEGEELLALLNTGATLDTAVTGAVARAGCNGRAAFGGYPSQFVMGTDRRVGQACLLNSYKAWMHAFTGPVDQVQVFDTCNGRLEVKGMQLGTSTVSGCPHDVPAGTLEKLLKLNFLAMYPE